METLEKISQFKDVRFTDKKTFDKWLKKLTKYKIHFQDFQQDLLTMWIHESGEILHCEIGSAGIYNGRFIDIEYLQENNPLRIWDKDHFDAMFGLRIGGIEVKD